MQTISEPVSGTNPPLTFESVRALEQAVHLADRQEFRQEYDDIVELMEPESQGLFLGNQLGPRATAKFMELRDRVANRHQIAE